VSAINERLWRLERNGRAVLVVLQHDLDAERFDLTVSGFAAPMRMNQTADGSIELDFNLQGQPAAIVISAGPSGAMYELRAGEQMAPIPGTAVTNSLAGGPALITPLSVSPVKAPGPISIPPGGVSMPSAPGGPVSIPQSRSERTSTPMRKYVVAAGTTKPGGLSRGKVIAAVVVSAIFLGLMGLVATGAANGILGALFGR
jgi:hypothetical protein